MTSAERSIAESLDGAAAKVPLATNVVDAKELDASKGPSAAPANANDKQAQLKQLLELALSELQGRLHRSFMGSLWVQLPDGADCPIQDRAVKDWLTDLAFTRCQFLPSSQQVATVVRVLANRARQSGQFQSLSTEELTVLERQPLLQVILEYMRMRSTETCRVSEWLWKLKAEAKRQGISTTQAAWPQSDAVLSRKLPLLQPVLVHFGMDFTFLKKTSRGRELTFVNRHPEVDGATEPHPSPDPSASNINGDATLRPNDAPDHDTELLTVIAQRRRKTHGA